MNLDQLLNLIAILGWLFFIVFAIVIFSRTVMRSGFGRAVIELLSGRVLVPLLLALSLSLLSAALVFVQPTEVAVIISIISPGGVRPQPVYAGLHFIVPVLENDVKYSIAWQTYTMAANVTEGKGDDSIRARTNDGQEVRLASSIIFRVNQEQVVTLHIDWQQRYLEDFVRPVVRGVVRTQVSQFNASEVNSSARRDLEAALERLLREKFAAKGLLVDQFVLRDITFTPEYAMAVELKQVALEDEQRALHEAQQVRNRAEGQRDRVRLEAEGQRDRLALEAEGKAKAILTEAQAQAQALQLIGESLQKNPNLLTYEYINKLSPNIRAMLVPNNAPFILPLPDLNQFDTPTATLTTTLTVTTSVTPAAGDGGTR
jgi:regulator of protease activity HflC (stomatin/prohibitin superfamily)